MGSPEPLQNPNKSTAPIIAEPQSAAFLDSPIFNYISNLSPIKPVKGTSATQIFLGFNSPPLISTSKRIDTHRWSIDLESPKSHISSREDNNNTDPNLENSSSKNSEDALTNMTDSVNPKGSTNTFDNEDDNVLASPSPIVQPQEDHELSCPEPVENDGKNRSCFESSICKNLTSMDQQYNPQLVAQVGQSQLGKRRRLQFEAAQDSIVENDTPCQKPSNTAAISEVLESSMPQTTRGSSAKVSKPSGIGLHLNSIVNAMPMRYPSDGGKTLISISSQKQDNVQCTSVSSNSNLVENVSSTSEEYAHQTPYTNAESMKMIEYEEKFDQGSLNSEHAERVDGYRSNPKKRRKKTEGGDDGCKYCNCKKTKCLKLYCDCFAAGIYCAGSCSCQGCFNRPEYESTVLETRRQIESRDPLAFAPKIVAHLKKPPRSQMLEDGDQVTPLAGRHKRGCNCKKSMCMKKYCECYQANVGCSEGCRCEGCQNTYGIKGEVFLDATALPYGIEASVCPISPSPDPTLSATLMVGSLIIETRMESVNENVSDSFDDKKLKMVPIRSRSSVPEFHKPPNLSPQTPSFQCSTHGDDASEAHVVGKYAPSPESECPPPYVTTTPKSPNELESYPNGEFSPGDWSCTSRTRLVPPSRMKLSSLGSPVSLFGGAKPSFNIIEDDTPNILKDCSIQQHNKVSSTSPNKKRVSPPRIRLHEFGSSTLKSGRKFILKAVPSFPPLTPCIDFKQTSNPHPPDNTL